MTSHEPAPLQTAFQICSQEISTHMPITTVIFDLGGVIVHTHWERATRPLSEMSGSTPDVVMEQIRTGDAYFPFIRGEFDREEFHCRLTSELGLEVAPERLFDIWNSIIAPNFEINPLIEILIGRYRIALGSNTDVLHYGRGLEVQEIQRRFDGALLSFELGYLKPDLGFFRDGLTKLSASPEECVFIDDRTDNVEAARSLGIAGIQFTSAEQLESELIALGVL